MNDINRTEYVVLKMCLCLVTIYICYHCYSFEWFWSQVLCLCFGILFKAAGLGKVEDKGITKDAILGNVDMNCPSPAKIVRIFTSSTFTGNNIIANKYVANAIFF